MNKTEYSPYKENNDWCSGYLLNRWIYILGSINENSKDIVLREMEKEREKMYPKKKDSFQKITLDI